MNVHRPINDARKQAPSLKMRAIALLSQREHSPAELRRKLVRIEADRLARVAAAGQRPLADASEGASVEEIDGEAVAATVDTLIAWLQTQGYLSEARFVESRIQARAGRYGSLRIRQELARHGLSLDAEAAAGLRESELERARSVWQRKFGARAAVAGPGDPAEHAR